MTAHNLERYQLIQSSRYATEADYENKQYPKRFTMPDKKKVDSRYSGRIPLVTRKIILLFVCILILLLIFAKLNNDKKSYTLGFFTALLFILITIPFFFTMKKIYYILLLYFIVIVILGSMGYGWGLLGLIVNLNPIKAKPNEMKNSVGSP
jgi:4-amino-4-deoxy-L-arabinose transferase-like glycosyltransferase